MNTIRNGIVVTRKAHRCWGCAGRFPAKSRMRSVSNVDGGSVFTSYWCKPCDDVYSDNMAGEEIGYGELGDYYADELAAAKMLEGKP